jgi:hypothetical protein
VNGATGVLTNATIIITFSEPMNPTTTASSFQSVDIPNTAAAFSWNQDNTRLTITPNAGLGYASGTDPNGVVARAYAVMMTDNATDAAGNRLVDDHAWSFRTARRIAQTLLPAPLGGSEYWAISQSTDGATRPCPTFASHFGLGELGPSVTNINGPLFIAIEIAGLPSGILSFETAYLSANQTVVSQAYAPGNLGIIRATHLTGTLMTTPSPNISQSTVLREAGIFSSTPALGVKSLDVSAALVDDYAQRSQRANKSIYSLAFDMAYADLNVDGIHGNDYVYFDCGSVQLDATYLVP